jgi:uncharacterized protein (TIGR02284 family)
MQTIVPPFPLADPREEITDQSEPEALMALYDRTVDSVQGYAKMVEKAESSFRDTAERFRALHARHADDLARLLSDLGFEAAGDGTIMGTVNRVVVTFRSFFDDIDEDVMDQVRSGEDWVLKAFDEAIDEHEGTAVAAKLRELQAELTELLADTRNLG